MNKIRQQAMRELIEKENVVTIKQLQELFPEVSFMTIHRDLDVLEQNGLIVKIRGGARAVKHSSDLGFDIRMKENNAGKMAMAHKALALIQPHSTIFFPARRRRPLITCRCS